MIEENAKKAMKLMARANVLLSNTNFNRIRLVEAIAELQSDIDYRAQHGYATLASESITSLRSLTGRVSK